MGNSKAEAGHDHTPLWYRPVLAAMKVADDVRRGASVLRYLSFVVFVTALAGEYMQTFDEAPITRGATQLSLRVTTDWSEFSYFLVSLSRPFALAAILYGFSFVLKNSVARLNLNIVLAHEQAQLAD